MYRVTNKHGVALASYLDVYAARAAIRGTSNVIHYSAPAVGAYDDSAIRPQILINEREWNATPVLYTVAIAYSDASGERVGESVQILARSTKQAESIVGSARPDAEVLDSWLASAVVIL